MRTLILAGLTMVTALGASAADAQRIGQAGAGYPMPGAGAPVNMPAPPMIHQGPMQGQPMRPHPGPRPVQGNPNGGNWNGQSWNGQSWNGPRPVQGGGSRWGMSNGGRWSGGYNAPGGWNAYRRPSRGWRMPNYWVSPNFYVGDYASYGLWAPPSGYNWYRYYDDAVLADGRGKVWDSRGGIDWDNAGYGYGDDGYASADYAYAEGGAGGYPLPPQRHHGAVTTYSTSSGYAGGGYAGGGYASGGYYYPGTTTTVVTIAAPQTVTTTTTEYIEETRTRYVAPRRVWRAPVKHYRPKCSCKRIVRHVEAPIQGS